MLAAIRPARVPAALALVVLACLSPVYLSTYAFLDDYWLLHLAAAGDLGDVRRTMLAGGRLLFAVLVEGSFLGVEHIEGLRPIRFLSSAMAALLAVTFWWFLVREGRDRLEAAGWALAAAVLPAFQVYAFFATVWPCALGGVAGGLAFVAADAAWQRRGTREGGQLTGLAVLLVWIAMMLYQPTAGWYWVFAAAAILTRGSVGPRAGLRVAGWHLALYGAGALAAFAVQRLGTAAFPGSLMNPRTGLLTDPVQKLEWFVQQVLPNTLSLVFLPPTTLLPLAVFAVILAGAGRVLARQPGCWPAGLALLALLPLAYLPNLIVRESWASYRTTGALGPLVALYALAALRALLSSAGPRVARLAPGAALAVGVAFALVASFNLVTLFIRPQLAELAFFTRELGEARDAGATVIRLVPPSLQSSPIGLQLYDEVGVPSFFAPWVWRPGMAVLMNRVGLDPQAVRLDVSLSPGKPRGNGEFLIIGARLAQRP